MTDPSFIPVEDRELLAVFPDRQLADDARGALIDAGVEEADIHIGEADDTVNALRSEQHDEFSKAWTVQSVVGGYPGRSMQSFGMTALVAAAIVIPVSLLIALYDFGFAYWIRAIIIGGIGLTIALAITLVVGPASGADRPAATPAAVEGVTLRVAADNEELRGILSAHAPLRVAEVTRSGNPIDTVVRQRPDTAEETLKDMAANVEGDDYHEQR